MRRMKLFFVPLAFLSLGIADAAAQVARTAPGARGWLGVSYSVTMIRSNGASRESLVIQEVVGGSPAQRAGVEAGDTILAVNDIRATDDLMRSLSSSLAPGDEVRLRVRRDGRDQELRVRAGEWPADYAYAMPGRRDIWMIDPDSLRGRVRIYLDSARRQIEMMPRLNIDPDVRFRRYFADSVFVMPRDSVLVWRSPRGGAYSWVLPRDSLRLRGDSTWFRFNPDIRAFQFRMDSIMRIDMDSMRIRLRGLDRGDWSVFMDSVRVTPRGNFGIATFGERGVAGAELTELNAGLGEYFGTDRGVLVVRVPDGTPAQRAGLQAGDVIVRASGRDIRSIADLRAEVSRARAADAVPLEILRKRSRQTIQLRRD